MVPVLREVFDQWFALFSGKENACGNKHQYQSPVLATKAAYNLEVKRPGEQFDVYKCVYCGYWHLGHAVDPAVFGYVIIGEHRRPVPLEETEINPVRDVSK